MTPEHEQLLKEMEEYIKSTGGISYSAAYADHIPELHKRILGNIQTVPATYIRTRSDRICFFPDKLTVFEYDAKTNMSGQDFFVECLPILHHIVSLYHFQLITVYGFRWPGRNLPDIGILINGTFCKMVDTVFVYRRDSVRKITEYVEKNFKKWFPNAILKVSQRTAGSGDPSIRIHRDTIKDYPNWKDVISKLLI